MARLLSASSERLPANHVKPTPTLKDAITILALSGMRVEELARMKVADLRDLAGPLPYIDLKGSKTAAARRLVPIHTDALPIFLRRVGGKAGDQYVFEELPDHRRLGTRQQQSPRRLDGSGHGWG